MMLKTHNPSRSLLTRDPFQNLFSHLFGDGVADCHRADAPSETAPRTNISETDTAYELELELPGVDEQDIDVQLHDRTLTVTAERREHRDDSGESEDQPKRRWHRVEHHYGRFSRAIKLPQDAAADGIEAVCKAGVLKVLVPKQPEAQPAKIAVRKA